MSLSEERPVQLGLCCMNVTLKKQKIPVYAARRIIVKQIHKLGIEELKKRTLQNLDDLLIMLQWNTANGIRVFRLSSEMFQHKNNPRVPSYTYDFALDHLKKVGDYAKSVGMRLTMHPGQFNNLGSPSTKVVEQTFKDLTYHAEVLDLMGYQYETELGKDSVLVIHGGGVYGDKKSAIKRWIDNYYKLPQIVRNRLVLENCEKCYSILDCLEISAKVSRKSGEFLPVVLDTHHFECYKKLHPKEKFIDPSEYIPMVLETWTDKGIKPKFHVSEQGSGKIGHHSDYIEILPEYLLEIPSKFDLNIDIMIEAKKKELSIQRLYKKYPQCNCLKDNPYSICKDIMDGLVDSVDDKENNSQNEIKELKGEFKKLKDEFKKLKDELQKRPKHGEKKLLQDIIEDATGCKVIKSTFQQLEDVKKISILARDHQIDNNNNVFTNKNGTPRKRFNECGNDMEAVLKKVSNGRLIGMGKASGYPDLLNVNSCYYLECKVADADSIESSFRSFYLSTLTKVTKSQAHILVCFKHRDGQLSKDDEPIVKDLYDLELTMKCEWWSNNKQMYSKNVNEIL